MDIIAKNIYKDITELSDLDLQRKLWLNQNNNTGQISSYVELMCRLFDDNGFDDFIEVTASTIGMSSELIFELNRLRVLLNNYKESKLDSEIINDPEWQMIVKQAKRVLLEWNGL